MAGFEFHKSRIGDTNLLRDDLQLGPSVVATKGDLLIFSNGKLILATATSTPQFLAMESKTSTSTSLTKILVMDIRLALLKSQITPLHNDIAIVSGTTTTAVAAAGSGLSGDEYLGAVIYFPEQDAHRIVSASSASSGSNVTFTFLEPLGRAPVAAEKFRAVPFGPGDAAIKLSAEDAVSNALADITGGKIFIDEVRLDKKQIICHVAA